MFNAYSRYTNTFVNVTAGGTISPRPEGEILHWQENLQKQEEAGKGHESPQGTPLVTAMS